MWKLPSFLNLLSNGGHIFSYSRALDDLNSKLGFDGIADFIDDKRDSVWWNSEFVGQAWITVPTGQVSKRDGQLETRREGLNTKCPSSLSCLLSFARPHCKGLSEVLCS